MIEFDILSHPAGIVRENKDGWRFDFPGNFFHALLVILGAAVGKKPAIVLVANIVAAANVNGDGVGLSDLREEITVYFVRRMFESKVVSYDIGDVQEVLLGLPPAFKIGIALIFKRYHSGDSVVSVESRGMVEYAGCE